MTTSFTIDILKKRDGDEVVTTRKRVHIAIAIAMALIIVVFNKWSGAGAITLISDVGSA